MKNKAQKNNHKKIAQEAGLVYVSPHIPGISRKKAGTGFAYYTPNNTLIKDTVEKKRINALGIPPAYTNVWISPLRNSHLQATGVDTRGRTQYRYHNQWRDYKNQVKHEHMIEFGSLLPAIRKQVQKDLYTQDLTLHKKQVLATVVRLLDITLIRVGNDQYAKQNDSYGLTTLRKKHVELDPIKTFIFEFKGKSHKDHRVHVENKKLFKIVAKCMEIPGYELFKYFDHGNIKHDLTSSHVNEYLHTITGREITAKDFRTWWATVLALMALENYGEGESDKVLKKNITKAVKYTSTKLGNTPAVCRKHYIYPGLIDSYLERTMSSIIQDFAQEYGPEKLSIEEQKTLHFLKRHMK